MSERFYFPSARGERLAAVLDWPVGEPLAYALLAHCFSCGKDNLAAKWIAEALTLRGIAVFGFDFTGLDASGVELVSTNISSNVTDVVAAADYMRRAYRAPAILIGHSVGGAAVLAAAPKVVEAQAVVTIAAPSDPARVAGLLTEDVAKHSRARRGEGPARGTVVSSSTRVFGGRDRAAVDRTLGTFEPSSSYLSLANGQHSQH